MGGNFEISTLVVIIEERIEKDLKKRKVMKKGSPL